MYETLKLQMIKSRITNKEIANFLGAHPNSISKKILYGSFSIEEAFKIRHTFFPTFDIEKLFYKSDDQASA